MPYSTVPFRMTLSDLAKYSVQSPSEERRKSNTYNAIPRVIYTKNSSLNLRIHYT